MPQRFYGNKDLATFEKFNRELVGEPNIDDCGIIDQFVILYRVSVYDTETNITDKTVFIIDDILDSGNTMNFLIKHFNKYLI